MSGHNARRIVVRLPCHRADLWSNFHVVRAEGPKTTVERAGEPVKTRISPPFGLDLIRDIQVFRPTGRDGVGTRSLNITSQAALNGEPASWIEQFRWIYAPSNKLMQIESDYDSEVYNGFGKGRSASVRPIAITLLMHGSRIDRISV